MRKIIYLLAGLLVITGLGLPACAPPQGQNNGTATDPNLPQPSTSGNLKISSGLQGLIQAQKEGNPETFAQRAQFFEIRNGSVLVTIRCAPGEIDAAATATTKAGGTLASSTSSKVLFDAYVPINNLEILAAHGAIAKIERAEPAVPPDVVGG